MFGEKDQYEWKYKARVTEDGLIASDMMIDSVLMYNNDIEGWYYALAMNERDKYLSIHQNEPTNYSFNGGTVSEYTHTVANDNTSINYMNEYEVNIGYKHSFHFKVKNSGVKWDLTALAASEGSFSETALTGDETSTIFHFEDNPGDFLTIDVHKSKAGWGPVFRTRGGQTSCPYEDGVGIKYYSRDMDTIQVQKDEWG